MSKPARLTPEQKAANKRARSARWYQENKERAKKNVAAYRAKREAEGNPVRSKYIPVAEREGYVPPPRKRWLGRVGRRRTLTPEQRVANLKASYAKSRAKKREERRLARLAQGLPEKKPVVRKPLSERKPVAKKQKTAPKPETVKKGRNYVNNRDLLVEIAKSKKQGQMTTELAKMLLELTKRYSTRGNFSGYTYVEEMQGHALLNLCSVWSNFDETRYNNPFAYYTQAIKHSFVQYLNKEKKQREIKAEYYEHRVAPLLKEHRTFGHTQRSVGNDEGQTQPHDDKGGVSLGSVGSHTSPFNVDTYREMDSGDEDADGIANFE